MDRLIDAILSATFAHEKQKDKGGKFYILHPLRVMLSMSTEEEMIVAVLHDTLEDTSVTELDIEAHFGTEILQAVKSVSRDEGETYFEFIHRAKQNPIGKQVKIQDILDNMRPERVACLPEAERGIVKRYEKALKILRDEE